MATQRNQAAASAAPLPSQTTEQVTADIEKALATCGVQAIASLPKMQQVIRMANGITALRRALNDQFMESTIMPLMGTPLGFLADRPTDKLPAYKIDVVRDCVAEALIRGFNVVGNEFNIISSRFYATKAGLERQVSEFPGLTDLFMQPGVPKQFDNGTALVAYFASWRVNGVAMSIDCNFVKKSEGETTDTRISVKVNNNMGADAVIGKATRKMYFRIYQRLHGSTMGLVDGDIADVVETTGTPMPSESQGQSTSKQTGRSQGQALKDMTNQKRQQAPKSEPPPPPANDALTVDQILRELSAATASWAELDADDARARISKWSPTEQRAAYDWAVACNQPDGTGDDELPPRPDCVNIQREPGEEG